MEFEEECHEYCNETVQDVTELNQEVSEQDLLIFFSLGEVVCVDLPLDRHYEIVHHAYGHVVCCEKHIYQQ